jgi:inner membrane protein
MRFLLRRNQIFYQFIIREESKGLLYYSLLQQINSSFFYKFIGKLNTMEFLSDPALIWFLIGLGLLLLELALPGLVVLFFGIGAWLTALGHVIFDYSLNIQILVFLVTSLLGLILLRKVLKKRFFSRKKDEIRDQLEEFKGHPAIVSSDFENGTGLVEFKGTNWNAVGDDTLKKSDQVVIDKKDNLTLYVTLKN